MANNVDIARVQAALQAILDRAQEFETRYAADIEAVHPEYRYSAKNLVHYLALAVWPAELVLDYGRFTPVPLREAALPGLLLAVAFAATLYGIHRGKPAAFLPFVCFAVLSPTSSFVPVGGEVGAERRMYVPLAALAAWLAWGKNRSAWEA